VDNRGDARLAAPPPLSDADRPRRKVRRVPLKKLSPLSPSPRRAESVSPVRVVAGAASQRWR